MILSIGMIVKNEEKYLRSCLEALLPILRQVDSELIIADTGSTDRTKEIAAEFTDQVFLFPWCDDFAAARNATLQRAKGEWFMAVDADELLENASELIQFFCSGEYQYFQMATFIQHSLTALGSSVFHDLNVLRLAKRSEDLCYTGAIHEQFNIVREPIKILPTIANHYGYIASEHQELMERKKKRNWDILLKEVEKDPEKAVNYHYLFQLYSMEGQYEKALACCEIGLNYAKRANGMRQFVFCKNIALTYYRMKDYQKALETVETYFQARKTPLAFDLEFYCIQGHSFFDSCQWKGAICAFEAYVQFLKEYQQGLHHGSEILVYTESSTDPRSFRVAVHKLACACLEVDNLSSARRYADLISLGDWKEDKIYMAQRLTLELDIMDKARNFTSLPDLYLEVSGTALELLQELIEEKMHDPSKRKQILGVFAGAQLEDSDYTRLMALRSCFASDCSDKLKHEKLEQFIHLVIKWEPMYADAIAYALETGREIPYLSEQIDPYDLDFLFLCSPFLHAEELPQTIVRLIQSLPIIASDPSKLTQQIWLSFLYLWALKSESCSETEVPTLFSEYAKLSEEYVSGVFQSWVMTEGKEGLLPKALRVGHYCWKAMQETDFMQCFNLKAAVMLEPTLTRAAGIFLSAMQKAREGADTRNLSELELCASMIKHNIMRLAVTNQPERAEETLGSYEQLCPDDPDLVQLKVLLK